MNDELAKEVEEMPPARQTPPVSMPRGEVTCPNTRQKPCQAVESYFHGCGYQISHPISTFNYSGIFASHLQEIHFAEDEMATSIESVYFASKFGILLSRVPHGGDRKKNHRIPSPAPHYYSKPGIIWMHTYADNASSHLWVPE